MGPKRRAACVQAVQHELAGAALTDLRQRKRLPQIVERMAAAPQKGLPQIFRDASQLEAAYRFFSNERVDPSMMLAAHGEETRRRAAQASHVVVAHDTTEFAFGGERKSLGRLTGKSRGFLAHFALAVDGTTGMPFGVLHCEAVVRGEERKNRERAGPEDDTNEALRWGRGAAAVHAILPGAVQVMDREADSYALFESMLVRRQDFVVRLSHRERRADGGPIGELATAASVVAEREVLLSPRKQQSSKDSVRHPARRARLARLQVSATRADLLRGQNMPVHYSPRLVVNVVRVVEPQPPRGDEPVEWMLYTSLPIDTPEQILAVVDAYRKRWLIEEFFKGLKTGCALEKRQLESVHALLNVLAISVPIAWHLLRLRTLARVDPDAPAESLLTHAQMHCLRAELPNSGRHALSAHPTAREVLLGIARLGGHLSNNGDPGWLVIGRGFQDLLMLARGFRLANRSDQS